MKKFLQYYTNPSEEKINFDIMKKAHDDSLIKYVVEACKSLEILKYIKFVGYKVNYNESTIDFNKYIKSRRRKGVEVTKYKILKDSRYGELSLTFDLECKGEKKRITKNLLFLKPDNDGLYFYKGKKYFLLYIF